jgi:molecular chaperone HtpG
MTATAVQSEKREFKTELKQLLHIITHSLYSNKEIFLRELISNASDAINKIRFNSLQHEELLEDNKDWKIKIKVDKEAGTLTVSDNGVGLSRQEAIDQLGTIAKSGTRAFLESLKQADNKQRPDLIGQFGVGFYSAFMVADRVEVVSRPAGNPKEGVRWVSDGQGEFTVESVEKPTRGTGVTLHLKPEERAEFLDPYAVRQIVKKFSDFIEHPVVMDVEKEDENKNKTVAEETLNARKAIWLRNRNEVTGDEYNEFYKQISNDFDPPAQVIHYHAEGANEFRVLVFLPTHKPFEFLWGEARPGLRLYVQRVLIMERCEQLLPTWLRFVRGVVDSSDLPLNISREILQHNPLLEKIQKDVVKSVLKALDRMKEEEYDKYVKFYQELGFVLKEGCRDYEHRGKLADLLLFESLRTPAGSYVTLAKYAEAMPADQKEIYYLIGESRDLIEHSPHLETFRARGLDVLLLTDPIDEFMIPALGEYRGKHFKAADKGALAGDQADEAKKAEAAGKYQKLFDRLKGRLTEVGDVRLSSRLKESASCLVAAEGAMSAHLERLLQRAGRGEEVPGTKKILELNGDHPAVAALQQLFERAPDDPRVEAYGRLLYEQAVIAEGSKLRDPLAFARRVNDLLVKDAGR